ncbi:MAG: hypothetical protein NTW21_27225 [Verrucomicrobia bacterium]|nr:hypothetical protein [Verrucomicrobiota bacterium]
MTNILTTAVIVTPPRPSSASHLAQFRILVSSADSSLSLVAAADPEATGGEGLELLVVGGRGPDSNGSFGIIPNFQRLLARGLCRAAGREPNDIPVAKAEYILTESYQQWAQEATISLC